MTDQRDDERAAAFRRLADGQIVDAYRLASAILGDPTDAGDAAHDAFIAAWRHWPRLRDHDKFEQWFKRIVVNECKDRLRRRRRTEVHEASARPAEAVDAAASIGDRVFVEQGLARLSPDDRVLLALRYYRDLRVDDIAAVLDIPSGTVKSRLNRAHARLRRVLGAATDVGSER